MILAGEEEDSAAPWEVRTSPVTPGRSELSERHVSLVVTSRPEVCVKHLPSPM